VLNSDGVAILKMTRMARSPRVQQGLLEHPLLEECRARVSAAHCELTPEWLAGAVTFVRVTYEVLMGLRELGVELCGHHIIALSSDVEKIKSALRDIPSKVRPRLNFNVGQVAQTGQRQAQGSAAEIARFGEEDDVPEIVIEQTLATDSSVGFPSWQHQ